MSDVTIQRIEDIEAYAGPNAIEGIRFRPAGKALGVSAWGMSVLAIDAGCERYPEHDHVANGQEEVYVILEGSATLTAGDESHALERGTMVRVGSGTKRKFLPGPHGVTLLAVGATPGKAYESRP